MVSDKKYFLVMIIVLILISIGGVWASDNQSATTVSADIDQDDLTNVDEVVPLKAASVEDENLTVENNDEHADVQSAIDSKGKMMMF